MSTPGGGPGPRKEVGDAASSQRHQPRGEPDGGPTLPANAHGADQAPAEQPSHIDDASMYDRRPGEDKNSSQSSGDLP